MLLHFFYCLGVHQTILPIYLFIYPSIFSSICPSIYPVPDIRLDESSCEISVSIDYSTDSFCDDKVDILESCGLGSAAEFDLEAGSEVGLDPDLLRFLRLKFIAGR